MDESDSKGKKSEISDKESGKRSTKGGFPSEAIKFTPRGKLVHTRAPTHGKRLPKTPRPKLHQDLKPPLESLTFSTPKRSVYVHQDIGDHLSFSGQPRARLGILLQLLASQGRRYFGKTCQGNGNQGWLRSKFGGSGGNQFYLWWAPQGHPVVKGLSLDEEDIIVRAIRHHDDHSTLKAGDTLDDYHCLTQPHYEDEDFIGRPWTSQQLKFIAGSDPVRIIVGSPGSGKTTALWRAIETRQDQKVLYLTWSRSLTQVAEGHFDYFKPTSLKVRAKDYTTFLGEIIGRDVPRLSLGDSKAAFEKNLERLSQKELGPWAKDLPGLFAEMRAHLIGAAVPGDRGTTFSGKLPRVTDDAYRRGRQGKGGIGTAAAHAMLRIAKLLEQRKGLEPVFPELVAAGEAKQRLSSKKPLPPSLLDIDRIVIDEVQDLTLLESSVVFELCRRLGQVQDYAPWLLIAGDEGQTVRPSGFEWGPFNTLLGRKVGTPKTYPVEENLRSPRRIAKVVETTTRLYKGLNRVDRPNSQGAEGNGPTTEAHLLHLRVSDPEEVIPFLRRVESLSGIAVISPDGEVPPWVPEDLEPLILSPAAVKGLEKETAIILNPGLILSGLSEDIALGDDAASLQVQSHRTTIDRLRVSLSRATEILAFLEVGAPPEAIAASQALLEDAVPFELPDLLALLENEALSLEDQVYTRIQEAQAYVDDRPSRAWARIVQAIKLIRERDQAGAPIDSALRERAIGALLATGARYIVDSSPPAPKRRQVQETIESALEGKEWQRDFQAFSALSQWTKRQERSPLKLLEWGRRLGATGAWLTEALPPVYQTLRGGLTRAAQDINQAPLFREDVEAWVGLCGIEGKAQAEDARRLRLLACDTLLAGGKLDEAEAVLRWISPQEYLRLGRLLEARGLPEEAEEAYLKAFVPKEAARSWREAGRWEQAERHLAPRDPALKDIRWLKELEKHMEGRPKGLEKRLKGAERQRLHALFLGAGIIDSPEGG